MNRVLIAGLLVGVGTLALAQAQPESTERPRVLTASRAGMPAPDEKPRVTVDFKGGTLAEYIAALRAAQPAVNVAITDAAASHTVPAINLREASMYEAVGILDKLRDNDGGGFEVDGVGDVYAVSVHGGVHSADVEETKVLSVAWALQNGMKPEDLLSAIDAAVQSGERNAKVKFHPETQLLIVRGVPSDLDAVLQTLSALNNTTQSLNYDAVGTLQNQVLSLSARVEALEKAQKPAGN